MASNEGIISEWWIVNGLEASGLGVIYGIIPEFAWRDWERPQLIVST
jgi:hypothetical protein